MNSALMMVICIIDISGVVIYSINQIMRALCFNIILILILLAGCAHPGGKETSLNNGRSHPGIPLYSGDIYQDENISSFSNMYAEADDEATLSDVVFHSSGDGAAAPAENIADGQDLRSGDDTATPAESIADDQGLENEDDSTVPVEEVVDGQDLLDVALELCNASQELWAKGNLEQAIDTLDEAYSLVMKVDVSTFPELMQQKEDLRITISRRILEIYASRYTAVNGNHKAIPLVLNRYVEDEIKRFQGPDKKFFINSYKRSGLYREKFVEALKEAGLPEELSWLPLIESGFKVRALSRARALGLWQFIPSTGYKFGLKRDTWIDERLDPEKSASAAIDYLTELHNIFGDWTTVLAGYNCGEGRVLNIIRRQKINYLDDFWDLYERLPRETAMYVPKFLAVLHILKDPEMYGFSLPEPDDSLSYETVSVEKQIQLKTVAKELGVPYKELTGLNPELRQEVTPPTMYSLKVPSGKGEMLQARLKSIPGWSPPTKEYVYHKVRKGETLSRIAQRYRASMRDIVWTNGIREKHFIRAGQKLKIPLRGRGGRAYALSYELLPGGKYKIKKGDSLWLIAKKFNTDTRKLQKLNGLKSPRLYVGQILKVIN
jgi:membrane-bound lytic murein transglycosylase D